MFIKGLSKPGLGWNSVLVFQSNFDCSKDFLVVLEKKAEKFSSEGKLRNIKNHPCKINTENTGLPMAGQLPLPRPSHTDSEASRLLSQLFSSRICYSIQRSILQTNLSYNSNGHYELFTRKQIPAMTQIKADFEGFAYQTVCSNKSTT